MSASDVIPANDATNVATRARRNRLSGAGKLTVIKTFDQAIQRVAVTRGDQKVVIKALAEAKGCPKRLSQKAGATFLH